MSVFIAYAFARELADRGAPAAVVAVIGMAVAFALARAVGELAGTLIRDRLKETDFPPPHANDKTLQKPPVER